MTVSDPQPAEDAAPPTYAAVILYYRRGEGILETVRSVREQTHAPVRICLVDNSSGDGVIERLVCEGRLDHIQVLSLTSNGGYATGMNAGAAAVAEAGSDLTLFLTHEVILDAHCLEELCRDLGQDVVAAGPGLWLPDGGVWSHGGFVDGRGGARHLRSPGLSSATDVTWLDGACVLVRTKDFQACGGFDERYFLYWEDVDLSLALRERGRVVVVPTARAVQAPSSSASAYYAARNRLLLWRKRREWTKVVLSVLELVAWAVYRGVRTRRADTPDVLRGIGDGLRRSAD